MSSLKFHVNLQMCTPLSTNMEMIKGPLLKEYRLPPNQSGFMLGEVCWGWWVGGFAWQRLQLKPNLPHPFKGAGCYPLKT